MATPVSAQVPNYADILNKCSSEFEAARTIGWDKNRKPEAISAYTSAIQSCKARISSIKNYLNNASLDSDERKEAITAIAKCYYWLAKSEEKLIGFEPGNNQPILSRQTDMERFYAYMSLTDGFPATGEGSKKWFEAELDRLLKTRKPPVMNAIDTVVKGSASALSNPDFNFEGFEKRVAGQVATTKTVKLGAATVAAKARQEAAPAEQEAPEHEAAHATQLKQPEVTATEVPPAFRAVDEIMKMTSLSADPKIYYTKENLKQVLAYIDDREKELGVSSGFTGRVKDFFDNYKPRPGDTEGWETYKSVWNSALMYAEGLGIFGKGGTAEDIPTATNMVNALKAIGDTLDFTKEQNWTKGYTGVTYESIFIRCALKEFNTINTEYIASGGALLKSTGLLDLSGVAYDANTAAEGAQQKLADKKTNLDDLKAKLLEMNNDSLETEANTKTSTVLELYQNLLGNSNFKGSLKNYEHATDLGPVTEEIEARAKGISHIHARFLNEYNMYLLFSGQDPNATTNRSGEHNVSTNKGGQVTGVVDNFHPASGDTRMGRATVYSTAPDVLNETFEKASECWAKMSPEQGYYWLLAYAAAHDPALYTELRNKSERSLEPESDYARVARGLFVRDVFLNSVYNSGRVNTGDRAPVSLAANMKYPTATPNHADFEPGRATTFTSTAKLLMDNFITPVIGERALVPGDVVNYFFEANRDIAERMMELDQKRRNMAGLCGREGSTFVVLYNSAGNATMYAVPESMIMKDGKMLSEDEVKGNLSRLSPQKLAEMSDDYTLSWKKDSRVLPGEGMHAVAVKVGAGGFGGVLAASEASEDMIAKEAGLQMARLTKPATVQSNAEDNNLASIWGVNFMKDYCGVFSIPQMLAFGHMDFLESTDGNAKQASNLKDPRAPAAQTYENFWRYYASPLLHAASKAGEENKGPEMEYRGLEGVGNMQWTSGATVSSTGAYKWAEGIPPSLWVTVPNPNESYKPVLGSFSRGQTQTAVETDYQLKVVPLETPGTVRIMVAGESGRQLDNGATAGAGSPYFEITLADGKKETCDRLDFKLTLVATRKINGKVAGDPVETEVKPGDSELLKKTDDGLLIGYKVLSEPSKLTPQQRFSDSFTEDSERQGYALNGDMSSVKPAPMPNGEGFSFSAIEFERQRGAVNSDGSINAEQLNKDNKKVLSLSLYGKTEIPEKEGVKGDVRAYAIGDYPLIAKEQQAYVNGQPVGVSFLAAVIGVQQTASTDTPVSVAVPIQTVEITNISANQVAPFLSPSLANTTSLDDKQKILFGDGTVTGAELAGDLRPPYIYVRGTQLKQPPQLDKTNSIVYKNLKGDTDEEKQQNWNELQTVLNSDQYKDRKLTQNEKLDIYGKYFEGIAGPSGQVSLMENMVNKTNDTVTTTVTTERREETSSHVVRIQLPDKWSLKVSGPKKGEKGNHVTIGLAGVQVIDKKITTTPVTEVKRTDAQGNVVSDNVAVGEPAIENSRKVAPVVALSLEEQRAQAVLRVLYAIGGKYGGVEVMDESGKRLVAAIKFQKQGDGRRVSVDIRLASGKSYGLMLEVSEGKQIGLIASKTIPIGKVDVTVSGGASLEKGGVRPNIGISVTPRVVPKKINKNKKPGEGN